MQPLLLKFLCIFSLLGIISCQNNSSSDNPKKSDSDSQKQQESDSDPQQKTDFQFNLFQIANTGGVVINDIAIDSKENLFIVGNFKSSLSLGLNPLIDQSKGGFEDSFVAKLDSQNSTVFLKHISSTQDVSANALVLASTYLVATGTFDGKATFSASDSITGKRNEIFVAQYSMNDGNLISLQSQGGNGDDYGMDIQFDNETTFIGGYFYNQITFQLSGSNIVSKPVVAGPDSFIFADHPRKPWIKQIEGDSKQYITQIAFAKDRLFAVGHFPKEVLFDSITYKSLKSSYNAYIVSYNTKLLGSYHFSRAILSEDFVKIDQIAVSEVDSSIIVVGLFGDKEIKTHDKSFQSKGENNMFIAKYSQSLKELKWIKNFGLTKQLTVPFSDYKKPSPLIVVNTDHQGNIYVAGVFKGTIQFDKTSLQTSSDQDAYLMKLDKTGNILFHKQMKGSQKIQISTLQVFKENQFYVAGTFEKDIAIDHHKLTTTDNDNAFILKVSTK